MDDNPLKSLGQTLADKPPSTVKELAKALVDVTLRLADITTIIRADIKGIADDNKKSSTDMEELKDSMTHMNTIFEQLRTDVKDVCSELAEVKKQQSDNIRDIKELEGQVKSMRQEIIDLKQYSRRNNLEIKNVPASSEESLPDVMLKIATCLKEELRLEDIDVVHRVPTKEKGRPNIVVKFVSRSVRDRLLQSAKRNRLTTSSLGFENNDPVYINEHLCPEYKILLGKAIQTKREKNWKFAWVSQSKVLMRKVENSTVLHIRTEEDLANVV